MSLNKLLSLNVTFLRVPEIYDGYEYKFFVSRTMTVNDVIQGVSKELGLMKSTPIPGGGSLEYAMEEVWIDESSESTTFLNFKCCLLNFIDRVLSASL